MKFVLKIELGNEAMKSRTDIAEALETVASTLSAYPRKSMSGDEGKVRDQNGNTCGSYKFVDDQSEDEEDDSE
jgi:hypothetical protein